MNARESAFYILLSFEKDRQRLDSLLEKDQIIDKLSSKERKFVYNLVSGVVRHMTLFDWKVSTFYRGNYKKALIKFKTILRLALYELDLLDFIPPHATVNEYINLAKKRLPSGQSSIINGILRAYQREGKNLNPEKKFKYEETQIAVKYSYPEWLIKRWLGFWESDFVREMCQSLNERPIFDIRINNLKISIDEFKDYLQKENIEYTESRYFRNVFKIVDIQKLRRTGLLSDGYCTVQDESGLLAVELIKPQPGDLILDACASPGGKYTALLERYQGSSILVGIEVNGKRIQRLKKNCQRLDLPDNWIVQGDNRKIPMKPVFDHILVDAPCSGFGTIQKHPDIKWRRTFKEILEFQKLQSNMLMNVSGLLKPDVYLIYSTCTVDPSENESVIEQFLIRQKGKFEYINPPASLAEFTIDGKYIRTFPHQHSMEGSFAVKLHKIQETSIL